MGGELAYQDLLAPAVTALAEEDQEFFHEGRQFDLFEDYIDMFQQSFTVTQDQGNENWSESVLPVLAHFR
jgi:hypothetical protein